MQTSVHLKDGYRGNRTETGTTALTAVDNDGPWSAITVLEEATFSTLTDRQGAGDAMTGISRR
jgi:hypothetical protein